MSYLGPWYLLCFLWRSETRGKLSGTIDQFARLLSCSKDEIETSLNELLSTNCATVTFGNGESNDLVTVMNRRMTREEKERESTRCRVKRHRNADVKRECNGNGNGNVTVPSSSSSSSSCTKVHIKPCKKPLLFFEEANVILTPDMKKYAEQKGHNNGSTESLFEDFILHHKSKASKFADWSAAWMKWVRNDIKFNGKPQSKNLGYKMISKETMNDD